MAAATAQTLDPSAGGDAQPSSAKLSPIEMDVQELHKADTTAAQRHVDIAKTFNEREARLDKQEDAMGMPPPFQQLPQPKAETTSPEKAWGSAAMLMAIIGSAFTRTPLTTALNAAGEAIKAFHQGDVERFQTAFKSWQVANENARTAWEYQQKTYEAILARHDRERSRDIREREMQDREVDAQLKMVANSLHDDIMIKRLEDAEKNHAQTAATAAAHLQIDRARFADQHKVASAKLEQYGTFHAAMEDWKRDYTRQHGKPPSPAETLKHQGQLMRESKGTGALTPNQTANLANTAIRRLTGPNTYGQAYVAAKENLQKLDNAFQLHDGQGVIAQATILDSFIQQQNNNRAVRQFIAKLFQHDAGFVDRVQMLLRNAAHGGMLSTDQINDIRRLAHGYMEAISYDFGDAVTREQWMAHQVPGMNPQLVHPDSFEKAPVNRNLQPWPKPSAAAIAQLKSKNDVDDWVKFDAVFGTGEAAKYAGEDPGD